jgi:hypothetical protein
VTIRVFPETREALRRLSMAAGTSVPEYLRTLVAAAEDDALLDGMNAAYRQLRASPARSRAHEADVGAWEGTLGDGLLG